MRLGTIGFEGQRLVEAREARGLTSTSLAEMLGVSTTTISQYEHNKTSPSPEVMEQIADKLNIPKDFFLREPFDDNNDAVFWRSTAAATKSVRIRAKRKFIWLKEIVSYLSEFVDLPYLNLPALNLPEDIFSLTNNEIEQFACDLRQFWGLGDAPIADLILVMENNGIVVSKTKLNADTLDAFSQWSTSDKCAYVILGSDKGSAARSRYDAAHELGHLLFHRNIKLKDINSKQKHKIIESQAFRFASAFLLPEQSFTRDLWSPSIDAFLSLKERWRTSCGVMIKRCSELELIEPEETKRMWINYSRRGYKKLEPLDDKLKSEMPRLLHRSIELLVDENVKTKEQILLDLSFAANDIEELTGLQRGYLSGRTIEEEIMPKLRLLENSNVVPFQKAS